MHSSIIEKRDEIVAACKALPVQRLDVFGSAARGADFDPARSDADFLVDFAPDFSADPYLDLKESIERILGRPIDLLDRKALETSRNYIRRQSILADAEPVYVAR